MGRHGFFGRRYEQLSDESAQTGKFGRMFPDLPPLVVEQESLERLGKEMVDHKPDDKLDDPDGDNQEVPAGYTYFGQFVDHDITFDTTSLSEVLVDPLAVTNFRTPGLDLDSLYGSGPDVQPYLYEPARGSQTKFLLGTTVPTPTRRQVAGQPEQIPAKPNDLPRLIRLESPQTSLAVIGDPRNDENLIVAQMHVAFLKFHNKVIEQIGQEIPRDESKSLFEQAREIVLWHYQWIVLHDFLRRILDTNQLDEVLSFGRQFYCFQEEPFIPVEFSVAAYRLGHSMVRSVYAYNRVFTLPTIDTDSKLTNATLELLFEFTAKSANPSSPAGLIPTLPSNWIIDWRGFFEIDGQEKVGFSRKLDPYLAKPLTNLPNVPMPNSLAIRNLLRGQSLGLPSGQNIAKYMGFEPLCPTEIASSGADGIVAAELGLDVETPLWYYILKEAQLQGEGRHLGQVGSRIVAEVFVGLLQGDSASFLAKQPDWTPTLPAKEPGTFTIADLLTFVGDVNPIGD